jgi:hypothetical protein
MIFLRVIQNIKIYIINMAGTRNKQTQSDFLANQLEQKKTMDWHTPSVLQPIAYPCHGINVQKAPSHLLSSNSVDIETYLYGIGSNNYIFPTQKPSIDLKPLPNVSFFQTPNLYIPILPTFLENQRP